MTRPGAAAHGPECVAGQDEITIPRFWNTYKAEFDGVRVGNIYLYPIFHHDSIVIEAKIIGHRGFSRLSDTDDPNGFYHRKFKEGLPQDLFIVDRYWELHNGRPSP